MIYEEASGLCGEKGEKHSRIPEKNVLCLGGHPNMIAKLKAVHPDWVYLFPNDKSARVGVSETGAKKVLVIKFTKTLSHELDKYYRVPKDIPVIYASSVNMTRFEEEIQTNWDRICASRG